MVINVNPVGLKNKAVIISIFMVLFIASMALNSCSNEHTFKEASIPDQVSYNFHIRPILSDNCFACHGPDANKRESGLRLDTEEGPTQLSKKIRIAMRLSPVNPINLK